MTNQLEKISVALGGNPNSGKTTLFNELTGARQHVGNYPGITVEKKEGYSKQNGREFHIVDLPGTYSLTAYSQDEVVARQYITESNIEAVVNIVDATNLERNLYLTIQLLELGIPVCIALNMIDVAEKRGIAIDDNKLSELMGVPVVPTIARKGSGLSELMAETAELAGNTAKSAEFEISYGDDIDKTLAQMEELIKKTNFLDESYPARWIGIKYLEKDDMVISKGVAADQATSIQLTDLVAKVAKHLKETLNTYPEALISDYRYGFISSILKQGVLNRSGDINKLELSDQIDRVVTNRLFGPLIMAAIVYGLYQFVFTYSEAPVIWLEDFFGWLNGIASENMSDGLLKSMVVSGIIDGVGGVLGFVPLIMFMFFGISILEDSGYLARVAFMLDKVFAAFGLHGNAVMAFIVSGGIAGGCAVPGVMASRTLKSPKEKLATLLTVPFMNCGAKMPVMALLVGAFFGKNEALMMLIITIIAWGGALIVAKLLRMTVISGPSTPFVMELPPYRLPTIKGLLIHTWERTWQYIKKAGTIILGISIVLWAMMTFPSLPESEIAVFEQQRETIQNSASPTVLKEIESSAKDEDVALSDAASTIKYKLDSVDRAESEKALRHSVAGTIGTALEPISQAAGFNWRTNIALVGGFAAKEVVVSTLGTAYSLGEVDPEESGSLSDALTNDPSWSPLVALSLILFTIFYAPCFVTVVAIGREAGSWKWAAFSMIFNTVLAFGLATLVFQIGSVAGFLAG